MGKACNMNGEKINIPKARKSWMKETTCKTLGRFEDNVKTDRKIETGSIWLRIGTSGGLVLSQ
jgi:hypothetical protein